MKTKVETCLKSKKKGISLIVLVITIIVMIILASTIILNLNGINIIERAKQAVRESNRKQIETLAQTIWSDGYLENKTEATIKEEIVKAVGKDKAEDFNIVVTNTGVIVENFPEGWETSVSEIINDVPIPKGFVISPYRGETTVNEGLVIYALSEEEIDDGVYDITKIDEDYQYSLENRNQFVWVPVSKTNFATEFVRDRFNFDIDTYWSTTTINEHWYSNKLGANSPEDGYFWEVEVDDNNMPNATQSNMNFMSNSTLEEVQEMYASVKKYGGFYIARYEVGGTTIERTTKFGRGTLSVTMGKYPYNGVPWNNSEKMNIDEGGAVALAREIYDKDKVGYGVVSTLTYGVQWDRTLMWIKSIKADGFDLLDSSEYGNYHNTILTKEVFNTNAQYVSVRYNKDNITTGMYDVDTWIPATEFPLTRSGDYIMTTGALKKANLCNIYDMAGNVIEWTMEGARSWIFVRRGGWFQINGDNYTIASRADVFSGVPNIIIACRGFRPSLYIK